MSRLVMAFATLAVVAVAVPQEPRLPPPGEVALEDFEWCEAGQRPPLWTQWGKPQGMTVAAKTVTPAEGDRPRMAMALSGRITKGGRDAMQVEAACDRYIPSIASEVVARLVGSAPSCRFHIRLRDAQGEAFGYTFPCPEQGEWAEARLPISEEQAEYHYGGDNDGHLAWPLVVQSVGVSALATAVAGTDFEVAVDEIAAVIPECEPLPIVSEDADPAFALAGENLGQTALSVGPDDELAGSMCTWLDYAWGPGDPRPNSFAELIHDTPLDAGRGTLFAWVKGDGSRSHVTFRVCDAQGEYFQITHHNSFMFWRNWRCVCLDVLLNDPRCVITSWGGDGVIDPPITFHSVLIDDWTGPERLDEVPAGPLTGRIGIGPISLVAWD